MSAAVTHVLKRMRADARLAWLIGPGSESFDLLTAEAASAAGQEVDAFRATFTASLRYEAWPSNDIAECDCVSDVDRLNTELRNTLQDLLEVLKPDRKLIPHIYNRAEVVLAKAAQKVPA